MINDPIVEEVRKERQAHAEKFGYNLDEIFKDLKKQEKKTKLKYVKLLPKYIRKSA